MQAQFLPCKPLGMSLPEATWQNYAQPLLEQMPENRPAAYSCTSMGHDALPVAWNDIAAGPSQPPVIASRLSSTTISRAGQTSVYKLTTNIGGE
jgi:hypothetical protein